MKVTNGINIFAISIFLPILFLGMLNVGAVDGTYKAPILQAAFSLVVFILGVLILFFSARGFRVDGSVRMILVGLGLCLGAMFFALYGFFSVNQTMVWLAGDPLAGRASWFLGLAALTMGFFLLLTVGLAERQVKNAHRSRFLGLLFLTGAIIFVGGWFLVYAAIGQGIFVLANVARWTPLGRFLQISAIMFLVVAAIRYLHGAFMIRSEVALAFATGAVLLLMSELTFAAVNITFDPFFWAAHLWLGLGFVSFLWGVIVAQRTHLHGSAIEQEIKTG